MTLKFYYFYFVLIHPPLQGGAFSAPAVRKPAHRRNNMGKQGMHGKTNFGCLFLSLLLIVGGYVGFKFGRVYLSQYMLDRKIFEIAGDAAEDWKAKRLSIRQGHCRCNHGRGSKALSRHHL